MQTGSADGSTTAATTGRARTAWMLASLSCCASLAAIAFIPVSFALGTAALRADPTCASYTPAVPMVATLRIEWLTGAGCVVVAWLVAWFARRAASASGVSSVSSVSSVSRAGRAAQTLSALALVGLILSFCYYTDAAFAACIG